MGISQEAFWVRPETLPKEVGPSNGPVVRIKRGMQAKPLRVTARRQPGNRYERDVKGVLPHLSFLHFSIHPESIR